MFPDGPPPETPRAALPLRVALGAAPGRGWLVGALVVAAGVAAIVATRPEVAGARTPLLVAAAGLAALGLLVAGLWARRLVEVRGLYRDGQVVPGRVARRAEAGPPGAPVRSATVQFRGLDGAPREATFGGLNQVVAPDLKLLVQGEQAGLYLSAYRVGAAAVPATFRVAVVRLAPPA